MDIQWLALSVILATGLCSVNGNRGARYRALLDDLLLLQDGLHPQESRSAAVEGQVQPDSEGHSGILIGGFNIQIFGRTKMSKDHVVDVLLQVGSCVVYAWLL